MLSLNMYCLFAGVVLLSTAAATPSEFTSNPVDCGGGYKRYRWGNCLKLYDENVSWNEANTKCNADGGNLAIIRNSAEVNVIKELISDQSGWANTWIGLRDKDGNNKWTSVKGEPIVEIYFFWAPTATRKNRCGTIKHTGELEDMPCDTEKLAYLCEKENKN